MSKPVPQPTEQVLTRLAPHAMKMLETKCPAPVVTSNCTPQQVGFALGVQYVLRQLREGFLA